MPKPGTDNESARCAPLSSLIDDASDCGCWRRNHHEFGYKRQFVEAADRGNAVDLRVARID